FIADLRILELVEEHAAALQAEGAACDEALRPVIAELVERAVQVKADVVGQDLRESHLREILNYGHTLAHAIEQVERFSWRHGAAVSVGIVFAAELSRLAGRLSEEEVERQRSVLRALGLPVTYRADRWEQLLAAMRRDKKSRGALLRYVLLDSLGHPSRFEGPDGSLLVAAYGEIADESPRSAAVSL